jgi:hypothetical protein
MMKKLIVFVLVCSICLLSACHPAGEIEFKFEDFNQAQFDRELRAWEAQNFQNYTFVADAICTPPEKASYERRYTSLIRYTVEGGLHKDSGEVRQGDSDFPVDSDIFGLTTATTIPELFERLRAAVQILRDAYSAGTIPQFILMVDYDPVYHFPLIAHVSMDKARGSYYPMYCVSGFEVTSDKIPTVEFDEVKFQEERAAWDAQGLLTYNYALTFEHSYSPTMHGLFQCNVINGEPQNLEVLQTLVVQPPWSEIGYTVPQFYDYIENTVTASRAAVVAGTSPGVSIDIGYDSAHKPSRVAFSRWPPDSANPLTAIIWTTFYYVGR